MYFQQVTRAVVLDILHTAKRDAACVNDLKPFEVGVVIFVIGQIGQLIAVREQFLTAECVCIFLAAHVRQTRGIAVFHGAK